MTTRQRSPYSDDVVRVLADEDAEGHLYALLDGARDDRIHDELVAARAESVSLYRKQAKPQLLAVAPWLVALDGEDELRDWIVDESWGHHWGMFLRSETSLASLRKQLRELLMVELPDGREVYFRFYDPRVLRAFLPTCDGDQLAQVFGRVSEFLMEGPEPDRLVRFSLEGSELLEEAEALAEVRSDEGEPLPAEAPPPLTLESILAELEAHHDRLAELDEDAADEAIVETVLALRVLHARVHAWTPPEETAAVAALRKYLPRTLSRFELGGRSPALRRVRAGLRSLLVVLT